MNILITGAGSGLGRGLALHFAGAGHTVFAADMNEASATETAAMTSAPASQLRGFRLDVTSDEDIATLDSALEGATIEVLINNAGLQQVSRLESFPPASWAHMIDVMLPGASRTAAAVLPSMKEQGFGRIVNIGSVLSLVGAAYKTAYAAAKHGLLGFSKSLALETADHDITDRKSHAKTGHLAGFEGAKVTYERRRMPKQLVKKGGSLQGLTLPNDNACEKAGLKFR